MATDKKKIFNIASDLVFSIAGLMLMNGMLQLLINPMLNEWMGEAAFGNYQSIFAVVSIMGTTFGVAANYSRMVRSRDKKDTNGDYNVFLTVIAVMCVAVAAGTLLPSILANQGPDVYLGLDQGSVINYAIRSAVLPVDGFGDFEEVSKSFNESAMIVLAMDNSEGETHYYGLPEAQGFAMMFVRVDVLADLGIGIPQTWDDIMAAIPKLQAKNMQMGLTTDNTIHLYQMGGELFADNGMRINLDSQVGLASFRKTCELFTKYGFPYTYDAANRFRTGEMPILIGD